jgi:SAM-dependent methyltransferase
VTSSPAEPWYVTAFGGDYRTVYPLRDLESARREIAWAHGAGIRGRALDLCCGFGRHTLALRELGVEVFGLDLSPELLGDADRLGGEASISGRLVRGDVRCLPFGAESFDSIVNLFSSFGYFTDEGDRGVLAEIARVLRPGGVCLFDLMLPERIRAQLVPESRRETDAGLLIERRSLEEEGRRVVKRVSLQAPSEDLLEWREDVRLYEPDEFAALLVNAGLEITGRFGGLAGEAFDEGAVRQVVLARRSGG